VGGLAQEFKGDNWWRLGHSFDLKADSPLLFWSPECVVCCPTQLSIIVLIIDV